jgi:hypothetical protein
MESPITTNAERARSAMRGLEAGTDLQDSCNLAEVIAAIGDLAVNSAHLLDYIGSDGWNVPQIISDAMNLHYEEERRYG